MRRRMTLWTTGSGIVAASILLAACSGGDSEDENTAKGGTGGTSASESGGNGGSAGEGKPAAGGNTTAGGSYGGATTGNTAGSSAQAGGTGEPTAGAGGGGSAGTPFVPEGISHEFVGQHDPGLELIAFTLLPPPDEFDTPTFFVSVKNVGTDTLCFVDVLSEFFDAGGASLASSSGAGAVESPMYEGSSSVMPCLGPNDIGMADIKLGLTNLDVSKVAKIEYGWYWTPQPTALLITGVSVTGAKLETSPATAFRDESHKMVGELTNGSSKTIDNPGVTFFAVDSVGRPYGKMYDVSLNLVPPGGSWSFDTSSYEGAVDEYVAYYDFDYP